MGCYPTPLAHAVTWADFLPYIAPYTLGAPDDVMAHAARLSAIEFSRLTKILKRTVEIDVQAYVPDYPVDLDDDYTVLALDDVALNGRPVPSVMRSTVSLGKRGWEFMPPKDLVLYPAPGQDAARGLTVKATVIPGQDTLHADRLLYDHYAETIGDGAVYRLLLMPKSSWYDAGLANTYRAKYYAVIAKAQAARQRKHATGPTMMRARPWV